MSSSEARVTVFVATMADAPQIEVPAAINSTSFRSTPSQWPSLTVNRNVPARVSTMIPSPAPPTSTNCDNDSCRPSRIIAKRRIRRMLKTTPGLNAAGVPTVLWNARPRTIAMISGLSAAIPLRLRSSNAAAAIVPVSNSPGTRPCPGSVRVLDGSGALEVKVCMSLSITSRLSLAGETRHRETEGGLPSLSVRGRFRQGRRDQHDQRTGCCASDRHRFADQQEPYWHLTGEGLLAGGCDAERNVVLGKVGSAFDGAYHRIALDQIRDPPAIQGQLGRAFDRSTGRGCFAISGRFHKIEDPRRDRRIVNHRVRRTECLYR